MSNNILQNIRHLGFQNDWKQIRIELHNLELQGGFKSVGYSSWQELFTNEFHQDYFIELRCAEIERLLNIPVSTYSALNLQVFAAFNNRQIKKIWSISQKNAQKKGVVLPSTDSEKDVKILVESSQKYIKSLQDKIEKLKNQLNIESFPENSTDVEKSTVDVKQLPAIVRQQFFKLLSQYSVGIAVRYVKNELKFFPNSEKTTPSN
ncbi:hypothetical protein [Laspinema palackyanum]|uniref:hypothetical protein n=1 Tax=Laspinema palackyanum TaxID=3231601 RepID=UPI00345D53D8|nr:hypothetical protein [Laspinema sp. D2c]